MKRKLKHWQELLFILAIPVPMMVLLLWPVLTSDTKPWQAGRAIPVEPPSEDRRVYNEAGFSIISPPNWTARNRGPGMIHLTPKQVITGRSRAGMGVTLRNEEPSDLPECVKTEFLGQPAYLKVEKRSSTFDDPAITRWTFYTDRDGQWFDVSYFVAEAHDEIPVMARGYLETVRLAR
jgi:hypothetical protein